jgi:hypothetical protein
MKNQPFVSYEYATLAITDTAVSTNIAVFREKPSGRIPQLCVSLYTKHDVSLIARTKIKRNSK